MDKKYTNHRVSESTYVTLIRDGDLNAKELKTLIAHLKIDIAMLQANEKESLPDDEWYRQGTDDEQP